MTCDYARCGAEATTRCRFGDGFLHLPGYEKKQTYVYYCDHDFQVVDRLFLLCDVALIPASSGRPFGP